MSFLEVLMVAAVAELFLAAAQHPTHYKETQTP
jgi:hypothetical protein